MAESIDIKVAVPPLTKLQDARVPAGATFNQVREELSSEFNVDASKRKVLFRGREMRGDLPIVEGGVKDGCKLTLAPRDRNTGRQESPTAGAASSGSAAAQSKLDGKLEGIPLHEVRAEVDRLERELSAAESSGNTPTEDTFRRRLNEYLSRAMEALDSIQSCDEQTRQERKTEVARVQQLLDRVDNLRLT